MGKTARNWKLTVSYDGTGYAGFQKQSGNIKTVQETLEQAVFRVTGHSPTLYGAGRTDAGVHAKGQVVNFFSEAALQGEQWVRALNASLPSDIVIREALEVPPHFHARFSAKAKTYSYLIYNDPIRPVFDRDWVYFYRKKLDCDEMQTAVSGIIGTHDFRSFRAAGSMVKTTTRTVNFCTLQRIGPEIRLEINADGFLYHMVRNIVGTLLLVGKGKLAASEIPQIILKQNRNFAGPTAPAQGLCLEEVIY